MKTIITFLGVNVGAYMFHFAALFVSLFNDSGAEDPILALQLGLILTSPLMVIYLVTFFIIRKRAWFNKTLYFIMSCSVILAYLVLYNFAFG